MLHREAKSLIRHLLIADLSKRYGNMRNGINDIKEHRWLANIDWKALLDKKSPIFYKPTVKYFSLSYRKAGDVSNFNNYPDSLLEPTPIKPADDPFEIW